ncbi:MAG: hypothetical protein FJ044_02090 [Candidatus Cloacimonetes bacterium]|nr:hypothetical protein [Candidatus Cloacimonadota bacterium]
MVLDNQNVLAKIVGEGKVTPVEVKLSAGKVGTLGKSLISFFNKYQPEKAFIYSKENKGTIKRFNVETILLPYHYLPSLD